MEFVGETSVPIMEDPGVAYLRMNDPTRANHEIYFRDFQNQNQIIEFTQALHGNEFVKTFSFHFMEDERGDGAATASTATTTLSWDPLLNELATREKLETVRIHNTPTGRFLPLFRNQFFQAIQRNPNVKSLWLYDGHFTNNNLDGFVSFLEGAQPAATELFSFGATRTPTMLRRPSPLPYGRAELFSIYLC